MKYNNHVWRKGNLRKWQKEKRKAIAQNIT